MAISFQLLGDGFNTEAFRSAILEWVDAEHLDFTVLPHTARLMKGKNWRILVEGSVTGVEIKGEHSNSLKTEHIVLGELASEVDWQLARLLCEMAKDHGASVLDKSGSEIAVEEVTAKAEQADRIAVERSSLGESPVVGCGLFELKLSVKDCALSDSELMKSLAGRVKRYASAHPASLMVLTSADSQHQILTVDYRQVATLIPNEATHITFGALGGAPVDGVVAIEDFNEIFGNLLEEVGNLIYVPAVDFSEEKIFKKVLREKAIHADEALQSAPAPVPHPERKSVNSEQWKVLESGPVFVFLAVAAADGNVSRRETTTFAKVIAEAAHLEAECPSLGRALNASLDRLPEMLKKIESSSNFQPQEEIEALRRVIDDCLSEDEAWNFKLGLVYLAREVAKASGKLFGIGTRINEREAAALDALERALGVDSAD